MLRVISILSVFLSSCSPSTTIMVVEVLDGTKYVRCAKMNSVDSYIIELKDAKEGEIRKVKVKQLKQKQ